MKEIIFLNNSSNQLFKFQYICYTDEFNIEVFDYSIIIKMDGFDINIKRSGMLGEFIDFIKLLEGIKSNKFKFGGHFSPLGNFFDMFFLKDDSDKSIKVNVEISSFDLHEITFSFSFQFDYLYLDSLIQQIENFIHE